MSLKQLSGMSRAVYKGVAYDAKGRFSPQGGFAAEYRVGGSAADRWVRCDLKFDSWQEALAGAEDAARAAIDKL